MTDTELGIGERSERAQRRRYWKVIAGLTAGGVLIGFVFGFTGGFNDVAVGEAAAILPDWAVIAMLAFAIITFSLGCWAFVRSIDEVDLADNLWGSTASYYAYAVLFPSWWVLGKAGITAPPDQWIIFFVALFAGLGVYFFRKWRAR